MAEQRKYRGLTKDGKWVYGYFLVNSNNRVCIYDPEIGDIPIIPETVGQFVTKDKNGKDVYAGDSVKSGKRILLIVWDEDQLQWKAKECGYLTPLCQWAISEQFELIVEDKEDG